MADEAGNPLGSGVVSRVAGTDEGMTLEDAETDLDLVETRGMGRQELEADADVLDGQTRTHAGVVWIERLSRMMKSRRGAILAWPQGISQADITGSKFQVLAGYDLIEGCAP